ncbi:phosphopantetheine-binding protein, partial [Streptomyces scabiei]|uniref:phosphopantetheine-binding protein n=1 Tax=Streptomyces scabiei TaxID=1930 RepID=UPI0039F14818
EPRMTVQISGANFGQPYPPEGGTAELPPPNPPRTTPAATLAPAPPLMPTGEAAPAREPVPVAPSPPGPIDPALPADPHWLATVESVQRHAAETHAACHRMLADSHMAFLRMTETTLGAMLGAPPREDVPALPTPPASPDPAAVPHTGVQTSAPDGRVPEAVPGATPRTPDPLPQFPAPTAAPVVPPARTPEPSPAPARADAPTVADPARLEELLLSVVAERTGYPVSMLNADMALDADLGVDSIKRVEILSVVRQRVGDLPTGDVAALGRLSTLREIVDALTDVAASAGAPSAAQAEAPVVRREPEPVELRRLALRTVDAPAPGLETAGLADGPVYVVGGPAETADLVAGKLTGRGVRAEATTRAPD